jgi:23S rRNA (guanosine2251-2'-O)-methyltransferase
MKRILCGPRAVNEALNASPRLLHLILFDPDSKAGRAQATAAEKKKIETRSTPKAELDLLGGDLHHQGVIAITGDYPYLDLESLLNRARQRSKAPILLALDQVQDVHNIGSIVRSSVALGSEGLILCRHGAAKLSPAAVRVSAGASEHANVARVTNLARALEELREKGFRAIGLDGSADRLIGEIDLTGPVVFVMGSEGSGLRRLVARACDELAAIPLDGPVSSLNVSVAAAIALFESHRQRRKTE